MTIIVGLAAVATSSHDPSDPLCENTEDDAGPIQLPRPLPPIFEPSDAPESPPREVVTTGCLRGILADSADVDGYWFSGPADGHFTVNSGCVTMESRPYKPGSPFQFPWSDLGTSCVHAWVVGFCFCTSGPWEIRFRGGPGDYQVPWENPV